MLAALLFSLESKLDSTYNYTYNITTKGDDETEAQRVY